MLFELANVLMKNDDKLTVFYVVVWTQLHRIQITSYATCFWNSLCHLQSIKQMMDKIISHACKWPSHLSHSNMLLLWCSTPLTRLTVNFLRWIKNNSNGFKASLSRWKIWRSENTFHPQWNSSKSQMNEIDHLILLSSILAKLKLSLWQIQQIAIHR